MTDQNNMPAPLFPDFDPYSELGQKVVKAKQNDGPEYWSVMREVLLKDFNTLPRERFKVWASVMSVPFMVPNKFVQYVSIVMEMARKDLRYRTALEDCMIGYGSREDFNVYSMFDDFNTTMNRITHMAHLIICGYTPEKLASMDTILELGGGIGEMTDIIYKLGFKGKYMIYDFPEVSNIQRYFHESLGLKNITYTDDYNQVTAADLCIATWSFTEMPIDLRENLIYNMKDTREWLIAYSNNILGIDNDDYIKNKFLPHFPKHEINFIDIPFMPWHGGTKYLTVKSVG
jgi:hypothetical protein